jgi:hypothetical protein
MAGLAAVNAVGESIVALLRARRDLLAADGLLGPVPATLDVSQASLGRLAGGPAPGGGLTLTCYRMTLSDHPTPRVAARSAPGPASLALDLHYLLAAWPSAAAEEQAALSWAMLELAAHPVLDRGLLLPAGGWEPAETVQIVPEAASDDALFRLWDALQQKLRLSALFRARVVRIGLERPADWPVVVASRFGVADAGAAPAEPVP